MVFNQAHGGYLYLDFPIRFRVENMKKPQVATAALSTVLHFSKTKTVGMHICN